MSAESERQADLERNLAAVRARIAAACAAAGRDPGEVTLIAVTKTYPASDVIALAGLGLTDFGENREAEAAEKAEQVAAAGTVVRWHFIGQLQTNKARRVAGFADVVHSVDRVRLASALGTAARAWQRELTCLVQVSLGPGAAAGAPGVAEGGTGRGGAAPDGVAEVAAAVEAEPGLVLGGLMAVAPRFTDPAAAFAPLRGMSEAVKSVNPAAVVVSAGMSGDLEAAVANGATHLRIGTALLGDRTPPVL